MVLKIDLGPDKDRGPGFGRLTIDGGSVAPGMLEISIQSNQTRQFLGHGLWQDAEAWHQLPTEASGPSQVFSVVGPSLIDPIALAPVNAQLRLKVKGINDFGIISRTGLLHSVAAGSRPPQESDRVQHEEPPVAIAPDIIISEGDRPGSGQPDIAVSQPLPVSSGGKSRLPLIAAGVLAALLAVGGGAYALLHKDKSEPAPTEQAVVQAPAQAPAQAAAPASAPAAPSELNSREDVARFIATNPNPADAVTAAGTLAGKSKLDLAMLVYQYASRAGSQDASVALAHMYDPETWSAKTSPMPQADAETAAYWYEPAAQAGNVEAQRRLGQILVDLNPSGFQRDKGKEWLGKAAAAGDAKAKTALDAAK